MTDIFYDPAKANRFDNLIVDVERLYNAFPITDKRPLLQNAHMPALYGKTWIPQRHRVRLITMLRQTHVDVSWFDAFEEYWSDILGGLTLWGVDDFYFLKNVYRMRFQNNQIPATQDAQIHLAAWQRPELIYHLFHSVYKESVYKGIKSIFARLDRIKALGRTPRSILDFGCGITGLMHFYLHFFAPRPEPDIYIADIQTLAFHYGAYRLRGYSNVTPVLLSPENDFLLNLEKPVDVILAAAVFEHLNQPLETARIFHDLLNPGGIWVFDYPKTSGAGLDTLQGAEQRSAVIEYVLAHFDIIAGDITRDANGDYDLVAVPVVRKKR